MTEKTRIEIALLLPTVPDVRDACVQRLGDLLKANDGIEATHIPGKNGREPEQICIHYDPDRLSIGDVRELARRAGLEPEKRFGHLLLHLEPMYARQARKVESRAKPLMWH
jgi:Cd2+/Zn2+-exporting ATPase